MLDYDHPIIGCPTWNVGKLQEDWDVVYDQLNDLDLSGKKIAIFGLGISMTTRQLCDAIGILGRKFREQGAELVGFTSTDGYEFSYSLGVEDGRFMGLALDEMNESERTPERVIDWICSWWMNLIWYSIWNQSWPESWWDIVLDDTIEGIAAFFIPFHHLVTAFYTFLMGFLLL